MTMCMLPNRGDGLCPGDHYRCDQAGHKNTRRKTSTKYTRSLKKVSEFNKYAYINAYRHAIGLDVDANVSIPSESIDYQISQGFDFGVLRNGTLLEEAFLTKAASEVNGLPEDMVDVTITESRRLLVAGRRLSTTSVHIVLRTGDATKAQILFDRSHTAQLATWLAYVAATGNMASGIPIPLVRNPDLSISLEVIVKSTYLPSATSIQASYKNITGEDALLLEGETVLLDSLVLETTSVAPVATQAITSTSASVDAVATSGMTSVSVGDIDASETAASPEHTEITIPEERDDVDASETTTSPDHTETRTSEELSEASAAYVMTPVASLLVMCGVLHI